jgi:hypothetical protein
MVMTADMILRLYQLDRANPKEWDNTGNSPSWQNARPHLGSFYRAADLKAVRRARVRVVRHPRGLFERAAVPWSALYLNVEIEM